MRSFHEVTDYKDFFIEGKELFAENNAELDFFGLTVEVNTQLYDKLMQMGALAIYTIRENNRLIGYASFIIQAHLQHVDHLQARQDVLFIKKKHRGHGVKFLLWCENELKEKGISFVFRSVTKFKDWSLILKRLDYEEVETIYMKDLRR